MAVCKGKSDEWDGRIHDCHTCLRQGPGPQPEVLVLCWRKIRGKLARGPLPSLQAALVRSRKKLTEKKE